jgi:voltage-gated potassium channel
MRQRADTLRGALQPFVQRFLFAALYLTVVALISTVGYHLLERWSWLECLYMAVTTLTSVGFMEVRPLSDAGRMFTLAVIALGITGLGIWWALTTALIIEIDLGGLLRRRQMSKRIEGLREHYIVCGAGRIGRMVAAEIRRSDHPLVVIENDPGRIAAFSELIPDALVLEGDALKEHTLGSARIESARGLAACLRQDADNLLVCMTARGMKPDLTVVARANDEESVNKIERAGANHVISPVTTGGIRMASALLRPSVVSFLDVTMTGHDIDLRLEEAQVPPTSSLVGKTLAEAQIPRRTGLTVLAIRPGDQPGAYAYNPGPDVRLQSGDVMIVLGRREQVVRLKDYARGDVQV